MNHKLRRSLLGGGLIAAAYLAFVAKAPSETSLAEPVVRQAQRSSNETLHDRRSSDTQINGRAETVEILPLRSRTASSRESDGLFAPISRSAPPKPLARPPAPPAPAQAPALPFTYLGKRFDGSRWEVFLGHGSDTLILHEGETIDGMYRVDSVLPSQVSLVYLPLNEIQTLVFGTKE